MSEGHSPLGASSYSRWGACPGSIRLSKGIDNHTTFYAAEGTCAHEVAASILLGRMAPVVGSKRRVDGHEIEVTPDMLEAVDLYIETIDADIKDDQGNILCKTFIEQGFHLKKIHKDLWGTADFVAYYEESKLLRVYDYKHGAGTPVEVKDNKQLKYYALGALMELSNNERIISRVEIVVVQPRCPHSDGPVRRHMFDAIELIDFGADLIDAVKRTEEKDAPLNPGDHCKFCPAAGTPCPKLEKQAQALAKIEFHTGMEAADKRIQLPSLMKWLPIMESWVKNVRDFAYAEARAGKEIKGFKLVQKRATRKWTNASEITKELLEQGLSNEDIHAEPKLLSPAQIEKLDRFKGVKNKDKKEALGVYYDSVSTGTTLVPDTDKRQEVLEGPKADFKPVEKTEDIFS